MSLWHSILFLLAGFTLLILSSDFVVRAAVSLSQKFKISPMFIGLTVVAVGTSAPELSSSFMASLNNLPEIALGNIVGSNIFNLLFITGAVALFGKQSLDKGLVKIDLPLLLLFTFFMIYCFLDYTLTRAEGFGLMIILILYFAFLNYRSKRQPAKLDDSIKTIQRNSSIIAILFLSLVGLSIGAKLVIEGAVLLGSQLGVSNRILGLTVVSIGTGLPELMTSVLAVLRKQNSLAFSNIIGSNIINTLGIPAATSILYDVSVSEKIVFHDSLFLVAATALFIPLALINKFKIPQWQGGILLAGYVLFLINL